MTQSNDKIKGPVRVENRLDIYDFDHNWIATTDGDSAPEMVHKLNGYDVAVKALQDILKVARGIDESSKEMAYAGKLAVAFTRSALKALGELDNGQDQGLETASEDQAGRTMEVK